MKIYLAGPLGFSEAGRFYYNQVLIPAIRKPGYELLDPWTFTSREELDAIEQHPFGEARREAWRALNVVIGIRNQAAIDESDALVAVLDGVDVDSGTAAEIGYAYGKGKPIVGYRGDFRLSADNEGLTVNLQVEFFIRRSGGEIVTKLEEISPALARLGGA